MAQSIYPLVDRILGGTLAEKLKGWRAEGCTHQQIAKMLYAEHDVDVVTETVRKWCAETGADMPEAESA